MGGAATLELVITSIDPLSPLLSPTSAQLEKATSKRIERSHSKHPGSGDLEKRAQVWALKVQDVKALTVSIVKSLTSYLDSTKWIQEFAELKGVIALSKALVDLVTRPKLVKEEKRLVRYLLKAYAKLLKHNKGYEVALATERVVESMLLVTSANEKEVNSKTKIAAFNLLISIALDGPSHIKIVEAANAHQQTRGEPHRFANFVDLLNTSDNRSLLFTALSFLNALVNGSNDWDTRNTLRTELDEHGLGDALHRLGKFEDEEAELIDAQIGTSLTLTFFLLVDLITYSLQRSTRLSAKLTRRSSSNATSTSARRTALCPTWTTSRPSGALFSPM